MTVRTRPLPKAAARWLLGRRRVGELARSIASARGRSLALVYHRVDDSPRRPGLVPSVSADVFRRHVAALGEIGDVVGIDDLLGTSERRGPRFALTFDDDFGTHVRTVVPVLASAGTVGTFFLSGRSMRGLGPYWFERLDAMIATIGVEETARRLGADARDAAALALECEDDPGLQRRLEDLGGDVVADHLGAEDVRAISEAGMTIGFHTVRHAALPTLGDDELREALSSGRTELEGAAGRALRHFAYPHGRVDARVASRVADAGFVAAWTGRPRAVDGRSDRLRLGRWEPGPVGVDDLLISLTKRLAVGA